MDAAEIVAELKVSNRLPVDAIRAAREDRASVVLVFHRAQAKVPVAIRAVTSPPISAL